MAVPVTEAWRCHECGRSNVVVWPMLLYNCTFQLLAALPRRRGGVGRDNLVCGNPRARAEPDADPRAHADPDAAPRAHAEPLLLLLAGSPVKPPPSLAAGCPAEPPKPPPSLAGRGQRQGQRLTVTSMDMLDIWRGWRFPQKCLHNNVPRRGRHDVHKRQQFASTPPT